MVQTWEYGFWEFIIQCGILFAAMLLGNTLRRKIPFINKSLLPSAVLGGIIILLFKFIPGFEQHIDNGFMESVTYHCLALGFIALTFKKSEKAKDKKQALVVVKTGATVVSTYLAQGIIGLIITILLSFAYSKVFLENILLPALTKEIISS